MLQPSTRYNTAGEQWKYLGASIEPYDRIPRPTQIVTFFHPFTKTNISIPMSLPEGTPRIGISRDRVVYNYGSFAITALFLTDGKVELIYDAGLLRSFPASR